MQVIVGTETGLLKAVDTDTQKTEDFGKQNFARSIVQSERLTNQPECSEFLYLTKGGEVHVVDKTTFSDNVIVKGLSQPIGFCVCDENIFVATKRGKVRIFKHPSGSTVSTFDTNGITECLGVHEDSLVLGGKERPLEVWDWKSKKRTWQADPPPPTKRLKLPQKLWVKKCCFLSGTSKIVSVTAQGQFQVHDTKLGTKPILNVKLCDEAFQTMFIDQSKQKYAYLGTVSGSVKKVRISDGRVCKTLKGGIGSIRSLFVNDQELLLCVGTGKYLRIHDVKKRFKTVVKEIYLKQRLTSLVVFPKEIKNDAEQIWEDLDANSSPEDIDEETDVRSKRMIGAANNPKKRQKTEE